MKLGYLALLFILAILLIDFNEGNHLKGQIKKRRENSKGTKARKSNQKQITKREGKTGN